MKQAIIKHYRKRMKKTKFLYPKLKMFVVSFFCFFLVSFFVLDTPPLDRSWNENRKEKLSVTVIAKVLRVCVFSTCDL